MVAQDHLGGVHAEAAGRFGVCAVPGRDDQSLSGNYLTVSRLTPDKASCSTTRPDTPSVRIRIDRPQ